jgi:hypothetical protein
MTSTISLRFTKNNTISSHVIRTFTWSDYSHIEFALDTGFLGALGWGGKSKSGIKYKSGVQIRPFDYNPSCEYQAAEVDVPNENIKQQILKFAVSQLEKPYDWTAIVGMGLHRDWHEKDSWFCSELVAEAFLEGGYPLIREYVNRVTPGMLYELGEVRLVQSYLGNGVWE